MQETRMFYFTPCENVEKHSRQSTTNPSTTTLHPESADLRQAGYDPARRSQHVALEWVSASLCSGTGKLVNASNCFKLMQGGKRLTEESNFGTDPRYTTSQKLWFIPPCRCDRKTLLKNTKALFLRSALWKKLVNLWKNSSRSVESLWKACGICGENFG
ncbi:hypothetical protein K9N68_21305 [Kovacikia minuta CCNUW1]|uniref:hypothetical protein n=1 Tax=Kovacikia minuta TaxID=2931930 RepID=UPI001CCA4F80|nr:hypothetical protein [Kovacikia minuta]UBF24242.1 hypothetical protein K9N68_21305 [Kovacikia minuta CCNUW1]